MYQQVTQQQVMYQQQPMMVQQQPMMVQQQPMMVQQQPMMVQQQPMMVQQQPMMVQQQPVLMVQQPVNFVKVIFQGDFLSTLDGLQSVVIQRIFEFRDICACRDPNAYLIYPGDQNGNQMGVMPYLKSKENSTCCCYLFCHPISREFQLNVTKFTGKFANKLNRNVEYGEDILQFRHAFQCPPHLCYCRPKMDVFHTENGKQEYLGFVKIPYKCFNFNLNCEVYNASQQLKYLIEANFCQAGLLFNLPCDSCSIVNFVIKDAAGNVLNEIEKRGAGFWANLCNISDIFKVKFPSISSKEDKALIIAATQFIDHMLFRSENEQGGSDLVDF